VPARQGEFNEFNVDRLRPYARRPAHLDGEPDPLAPVVGPGVDGVPEHEVAELLKFKMRRRPGATAGPTSSVTSWCRGGGPRTGRDASGTSRILAGGRRPTPGRRAVRGTADSLLDSAAASSGYGARWPGVLLSPARRLGRRGCSTAARGNVRRARAAPGPGVTVTH
jgi:hypothetical protein